MVESYIYLNKGQFQASLVDADGQTINAASGNANVTGFTIRTDETSEVFETAHAAEWL